MRHHNLTFLLAATLTLCAAVGCKRFKSNIGGTFVPFTNVSDSWEIGAEIKSLNVDIRAGALRVVAAEDTGVQIEATVKNRESRANPDANRGTFADHVRVETQGETLIVADAHTGQPDEKDWRVSFVLRVPAELAVNLRTSAGRITVDGMTSDIKATSGAGEIVIRSGTAGGITAGTEAGRIEITVDSVTGPVTANAVAGAVSFSVAKTAPPKDVVLTAGIGDVLLRIPAEAAGTFDLRSDVGHVSVEGHAGIEVKRVVVGATGTGTIGQGGPTYKVQASAGSVRVR